MFLEFCLIMLVGLIPAVISIFSYYRQILFFPFHHDSFALEEVVEQEIRKILIKDVAYLIIADLLIKRVPIGHLLDFVVYSLREVAYAFTRF